MSGTIAYSTEFGINFLPRVPWQLKKLHPLLIWGKATPQPQVLHGCRGFIEAKCKSAEDDVGFLTSVASGFRPVEESYTPVNINTEVPYDTVLTATCNLPQALGPTQRSARCVFDFTDDKYKLLGDSFNCAGMKSHYTEKMEHCEKDY